MSVDEQCFELAKHFLRDLPGATAEDETELAKSIQTICEIACTNIEERDQP